MSEIKASRFIKHLYYVVPILLVLYVLSIGPFFAIVVNISNSSVRIDKTSIFSLENYETFYTPLLWVIEKNQFIEKLEYDYTTFCVDMICV